MTRDPMTCALDGLAVAELEGLVASVEALMKPLVERREKINDRLRKLKWIADTEAALPAVLEYCVREIAEGRQAGKTNIDFQVSRSFYHLHWPDSVKCQEMLATFERMLAVKLEPYTGTVEYSCCGSLERENGLCMRIHLKLDDLITQQNVLSFGSDTEQMIRQWMVIFPAAVAA